MSNFAKFKSRLSRSPWKRRRAVFALCLGIGLAAPVGGVFANGQIRIDQMAPASAYDPGVLEMGNGGLAPTLWQGTNAKRAEALLDDIKPTASATARRLIASAILSGGVPPQATDNFEHDEFRAARLAALLRLGDLENFDALSLRMNITRSTPSFAKVFIDRDLLGGNTTQACGAIDLVTTERKAPYWAKRRAFCHVVRDEIPAAELTADLLARSGHKDPVFFDLLGKLTGAKPRLNIKSAETPLRIAMLRLAVETARAKSAPDTDIRITKFPRILSAQTALAASTPNEKRQSAFIASADILSPAQITQVLTALGTTNVNADLSVNTDTLAGDLNGPANAPSQNPWGLAFAQVSNNPGTEAAAQALSDLLVLSKDAGILPAMAPVLNQQAVYINADQKATTTPALFARLAVLSGDVNVLRGLFGALPADHALRPRIALASDALGGGFLLGELGTDIETRLSKTGKAQTRAVRDSYIAVAMGANLSQTAADALGETALSGTQVNPGKLLALQASARRGAQAETALLAADLLANTPSYRADSFAAILSALNTAGLNQNAGWIAAQDIFSNVKAEPVPVPVP